MDNSQFSPARSSNLAGGHDQEFPTSYVHAAETIQDGPSQSSGPGRRTNCCTKCRIRKIKCDKMNPCSNCVKARVLCEFPSPSRVSRKRQGPSKALSARISKIEKVVERLGLSFDDSDSQALADRDRSAEIANMSPINQPPSAGESPENGFGRLVINKEGSRYFNNRVWAELSVEVSRLRDTVDALSDNEDEELSSFSAWPEHLIHSYPFGFDHTMLQQHPSEPHIEAYWNIYKEACDPVMKLVHLPSMETHITSFISDPTSAPKSMHAFMFSVYFAVVKTLSPGECLTKFGESLSTLSKRFHIATQQALVQANFLTSKDPHVIHAFMWFLFCVRGQIDGRALWCLCGILTRQAICAGLHRDGRHFGLSPFESELRRRTYWQIILLDQRSSQESGLEPTTSPMASDVEAPLNINNEDLHPDMSILPTARNGITDMSLCLLRCDMSKSVNKLIRIPRMTLEDRLLLLAQTSREIEEKYLRYCDLSRPLDYCVFTVAKLMIAHEFLFFLFPVINILAQETSDRLFISCVSVLEFWVDLEQYSGEIRFAWLFKTYNRWHTIAYVLSELTRRVSGAFVERAWLAVPQTLHIFQKDPIFERQRRSWNILWPLFQKARSVREQELARRNPSTVLGLAQLQTGANSNIAAQDLATPGSATSRTGGAKGQETLPFPTPPTICMDQSDDPTYECSSENCSGVASLPHSATLHLNLDSSPFSTTQKGNAFIESGSAENLLEIHDQSTTSTGYRGTFSSQDIADYGELPYNSSENPVLDWLGFDPMSLESLEPIEFNV